MPNIERRIDRGTRTASVVLRQLGDELREARVLAGVSQERLGSAAGLSHTEVSRLERGLIPGASFVVMGRLLAVVGMRLSARAYPDGPPIRDVAHARLLNRLAARLPPSTHMRLEVPLRVDEADLRAWDAELVGATWQCKVEAETRLTDLQAVERRIALKMADCGVDRVILLVASTHHNRLVLREFASMLRDRFPLSGAAVLRALADGACPAAGGIVML